MSKSWAQLGWNQSVVDPVPEDWDVGPLDKVLTSVDAGRSPDLPDRPAQAGEWGVLKVSAIRSDGLRETDNKVVIQPSLIDPSIEVKHGDLLISRANTPARVGLACYVRKPRSGLMLSDKTLRLNIDSTLALPEFISYLLQAPLSRRQIETSGTGTSGSMKNITQDEIRSLVLPLPEIHEQYRLVEILDTAHEVLRSTEWLIAKLEQTKKGLIRDLIGVDVGTLHRLDDAAKVTVGHVGPTEDFYTDADKGVIFLRTGNITEKGISLKNLRYVPEAFHMANRKSALFTGDVVISRVGYTGTAAVIPELGQANCANMIIVRPGNMLDSSYLRLLFESELVTGQVSAFTAGSAQPVLNIRLVQRLRIPVPSLTVQADITDAVARVDDRIAAEERDLAKRRLLKRGLMDDLLTGRVRVGASG